MIQLDPFELIDPDLLLTNTDTMDFIRDRYEDHADYHENLTKFIDYHKTNSVTYRTLNADPLRNNMQAHLHAFNIADCFITYLTRTPLTPDQIRSAKAQREYPGMRKEVHDKTEEALKGMDVAKQPSFIREITY